MDSGSGFAALGDAVSGVSTTLFDSSAGVEVGNAKGGTAYPFLGSLSRARVWDTAIPDSSTPVLDIDFSLPDKGASSFTATSGQTVTINGAAAIKRATDGTLTNGPLFKSDAPYE